MRISDRFTDVEVQSVLVVIVVIAPLKELAGV
jgi:hypothetical protein